MNAKTIWRLAIALAVVLSGLGFAATREEMFKKFGLPINPQSVALLEEEISARVSNARYARTDVPWRAGQQERLRELTDDFLRSLHREITIYGPDDRVEALTVTGMEKTRNVESTAAIMYASDIKRDAARGLWTLTANTLESTGVCSDDPFAKQLAAATCTAFLIGEDLLATAAHCITSDVDARSKRFVLGFRLDGRGTPRTTFTDDDVYEGTIQERLAAAAGPEWALIKLSRKVANREPLPYRKSGKIADAADVYSIGYPAGVPSKFAPNANVRDNSLRGTFIANLDMFGGNSGSPVFAAGGTDPDIVEGILVRGEVDWLDNGECLTAKKCPTSGCSGEEVTRITELPPL